MIVVAARLGQFLAAVVLFGSPLFFLYAIPVDHRLGSALRWSRSMLASAGALLGMSATIALAAQTAVMTGSPVLVFDMETLWAVLEGTQYGHALGARLMVTVLALVLCVSFSPSKIALTAVSVLGALILASFAWTGHGATGVGAWGVIQVVNDAVHLLAAGVWLGALAVLAILLVTAHRRTETTYLPTLHRALRNFSGVGSVSVAALVATGLINSWFLIGPSHLGELFRTSYGWLLLTKLLAFLGMLLLAAINRFFLTPGLGGVLAYDGPTAPEVHALRRSVLLEAGLGIAVLALVSAMGTLAPPSSEA